MYENMVILPDAQDDIDKAYWYYEGREINLGERFLDILDSEFKRIIKNPDLFGLAFDDYRRVAIHKFPFFIYYRFDNGKVIIYSVFNTSQEPAKLLTRLKFKDEYRTRH